MQITQQGDLASTLVGSRTWWDVNFSSAHWLSNYAGFQAGLISLAIFRPHIYLALTLAVGLTCVRHSDTSKGVVSVVCGALA